LQSAKLMTQGSERCPHPNNNYDPVEVTALTAPEVERATTAALTAIAGASTLDELKEARIAHAPVTRRRSPWPVAEIGAPAAAGPAPPPRAGSAPRRPRSGTRSGAPGAARAASVTSRCLITRARRRHPAVRPRAAGRPPPGQHAGRQALDVFVAMGYEVAEGPRSRPRWYKFDALNIPPDHPAGRCRTRCSSRRRKAPPRAPRSGLVLRTPHPRRCRSGPC